MRLAVLSTDDLDNTITVMVDGTRYEYWVRHLSYWSTKDRVNSLVRLGAPGKALNYLKSHSYKCDNLEKTDVERRQRKV